MRSVNTFLMLTFLFSFFFAIKSNAQVYSGSGEMRELFALPFGNTGIRFFIKPKDIPWSRVSQVETPMLASQHDYADLQLSAIKPVESGTVKKIGNYQVSFSPNPFIITVKDSKGNTIQTLDIEATGDVSFNMDSLPVLGLGEGANLPSRGSNWRNSEIDFDRRGKYYKMQPRWQSDAYGSRNPVPLIIGTGGWALFFMSPWGEVDLRNTQAGVYKPFAWREDTKAPQTRGNQREVLGKGLPPETAIIPGFYDFFVFDVNNPKAFYKDISILTGRAVMPPRWALGYMQSTRTLESDEQMIDIVETFRKKRIPVDAMIYLSTGFSPRGWNTLQPSFTPNPEVFRKYSLDQFISVLHSLNARTILHIVPWDRDELPTLKGDIPPREGEIIDNSHILDYWNQHKGLVNMGVDGFWPDEGDWFNLFERMNRHKLYYQGPTSEDAKVRPWNIQRNGYLGIAKWGGWIWSGDTESAWKTLEGQIAVGLNTSLSLSPFWGSDIGGFYPNPEYTAELFTRWVQFATFCPSFRSHGRTWWLHLPWGWSLDEMGPLENGASEPLMAELGNVQAEQIFRKFDELRYQLLPYNYSLAQQVREDGLPMMRAMWLEYPDEPRAVASGSQFMWGQGLLISPVFRKGVKKWNTYLPKGVWYDWWTNNIIEGGRDYESTVDLTTIPIFVPAGAIIPFDPVRQYTDEKVEEATTIKIYTGKDGKFTLYEDDGKSLDYLDGIASWTNFEWNDTKRKLIISPRNDKKNGYTAGLKRSFKVELIPEMVVKDVMYENAFLAVDF